MEHNNNSGFGNGFVLGLLVGGVLVFGLGTQRGRRLLKVLTEEGLEGVSELHDLIEEYKDVEDFEEEPLTQEKESHKKTGEKKEASEDEIETDEENERQTNQHRFFKKLKKK